MNTEFPQLDRGLHDIVANVPVTAPPTDTLIHRGHRVRRRRRVTAGIVGSACALLVLAGVAAAVTAPDPSNPGRRGQDTAATQPRFDPVAAVTATEQTSYTYTMNYRAVPIDGAARTDADEELLANFGGAGTDSVGAFDPATTTGFHRTQFQDTYERRLINGELFDGTGGVFLKAPGSYKGLRVGVPGMGDFSVSAGGLLGALRDQGAKVTETERGRYRFDVVVPPSPPEGKMPGSTAAVSVSGTVTLTDDGKHVRELQFSATHPEPNMVRGVRIVVTLKFADYGAPVTVERPAVR